MRKIYRPDLRTQPLGLTTPSGTQRITALRRRRESGRICPNTQHLRVPALEREVAAKREQTRAMQIEQVTLIVDDYDEAIRFFVETLGFELVEDTPATTNDGRPKRWVVVRPPGATAGLLLAQADGDEQRAAVGNQFAGRVGLFLRVDDFELTYQRLCNFGVEWVSQPRDEPYGRVAVFVDVAGNRWDLLG